MSTPTNEQVEAAINYAETFDVTDTHNDWATRVHLKTLSTALADARRRLEGLSAARIGIGKLIDEARSATQRYGDRKGKPIKEWAGRFEGLTCAESLLTFADFPEQNADDIRKILDAARKGAGA